MSSVNKAIVLGNLGQDPELRYTQTGMAVCSFSVATTEYRTDREGNKQENTEWHRITVWGKTAENCSKYLSKGSKVFVEGRMHTNSWDDKQTGQKRYSKEIVASNVQFIGANPRSDNRGGPSQGGYAPQQGGMGQGQPSYESAPQPPSPSGVPDMGAPATPNLDDIPF